MDMGETGLHKNELDTPFLWVDLDAMEKNIAELARHFSEAGVNWRPHTKGIKVPAIAHQAIAAGAIGVTCAKLGEAEVMAAAGISDILVANQVVGQRKVARLANLCGQVDVKVAVDNADNLAAIGGAAVEKGVEVGVLVEVDTGMGRAGVAPGQAAVDLSRLAADTAGINYQGLMAWEGHAVSLFERREKREAIERSVGQLVESADMCRSAGLPVPIVSGGGQRYLQGYAVSGRNHRNPGRRGDLQRPPVFIEARRDGHLHLRALNGYQPARTGADDLRRRFQGAAGMAGAAGGSGDRGCRGDYDIGRTPGDEAPWAEPRHPGWRCFRLPAGLHRRHPFSARSPVRRPQRGRRDHLADPRPRNASLAGPGDCQAFCPVSVSDRPGDVAEAVAQPGDFVSRKGAFLQAGDVALNVLEANAPAHHRGDPLGERRVAISGLGQGGNVAVGQQVIERLIR